MVAQTNIAIIPALFDGGVVVPVHSAEIWASTGPLSVSLRSPPSPAPCKGWGEGGPSPTGLVGEGSAASSSCDHPRPLLRSFLCGLRTLRGDIHKQGREKITVMGPISRICGTSSRCWRRLCSIMWRSSPGSRLPRRGIGSRGSSLAGVDSGGGQGVPAEILAATNRCGVFHGIDAMPMHIDHARRLAAAAAIPNLLLHAVDFAAASGLELPQFDYIV